MEITIIPRVDRRVEDRLKLLRSLNVSQFSKSEVLVLGGLSVTDLILIKTSSPSSATSESHSGTELERKTHYLREA